MPKVLGPGCDLQKSVWVVGPWLYLKNVPEVFALGWTDKKVPEVVGHGLDLQKSV